ncbi:MAG: DinB family protein [Chitinophagaceae bacterium]
MYFSLSNSLEILERTPGVLFALLQNLSVEWTVNNEGGQTWNVHDIIGHLIHGEKTDWIPRTEIILSNKQDKIFAPFDRFAQFEKNKERKMSQLLNEFKTLRQNNIAFLQSLKLTDQDFKKTGIHPAFGEVTLSQLLSTWTVHDLNHLAQISRVIAKQYNTEVGPWTEYLRILQS